jgi:hypothetical protein
MNLEWVAGALDSASRARSEMAEYGTVAAVNADGTVSVELGRGPVNSVPVARSYRNRAEGDAVLVVYARQGPVVLCAIGAADVPTVISVSDDPPPTGQGWEAVNVYARGGVLWGDRVTAAPPVSGTTVTATAPVLASYRGGALLRTGYAEQGDPGGWGMHTGLVVFAAGVWAPLAGKTPTSGSVVMHRRNSEHGPYAATPVTMWRAAYTAAPPSTPTYQTGSLLGPALLRNQTSAPFALPTSWLAPFCAGTATALVFDASTASENVEIDSLTLTITAT